jgi:hypothetical protein
MSQQFDAKKEAKKEKERGHRHLRGVLGIVGYVLGKKMRAKST